MKKIIILIISMLLVVGCSKKDPYALGKYKDRQYTNDVFSLEFEIPEGFSYLTVAELAQVNQAFRDEFEDNEDAKYRNVVVNISHVDETKLVAFVDSHPNDHKHPVREANELLDFLTSQNVNYSMKKSYVEINGLEYLKLELNFDFNQSQINYIGANNNRLINIQINFSNDNHETKDILVSLYE